MRDDLPESYWDKQDRMKELISKISKPTPKSYFKKLKKLAEDSDEEWYEGAKPDNTEELDGS